MNPKIIQKIGIAFILVWVILIIGGSIASWEMFKGDKGYVTFEDYYGNIIIIKSMPHLILITFQYPSIPVVLLIVGITLLVVSAKITPKSKTNGN